MADARYVVAQQLRRPLAAYRRRWQPAGDPLGQAMLEAHAYRGAMYDFMHATAANREILHDLPVEPGSVALDVGAYVGEWAAGILGQVDVTVHAFEPSSQGVADLRSRFADEPRVQVHPYGLGRADATSRLALAGPGSLVSDDPGAFGAEQVEVRDVVEVLDELDLDRIGVMKCNIEGGEFDLFERLIESDRLGAIDVVLVQFHEWHPGAHRRRRAIRRELARRHEELWDYPWVFECWRRR